MTGNGGSATHPGFEYLGGVRDDRIAEPMSGMERTTRGGTVTTSRSRAAVRGTAGPVEIALVVAAAVIVWWLAMGWDWSVVPADSPNSYRDPQSGLDWALVYLTAMACVGWLALRGRAVVGAVAVVLPLVVLSGWRMAAAEVIGANLWPIGLAVMIVTLAVVSAAVAAVGAWLRRRRLAGTAPESGPSSAR